MVAPRSPALDSEGVRRTTPTEYAPVVFAVLYRWKLRSGAEPEFRDAWRAATVAIRARYGTFGSRLHRADDDEIVAYALWPDRASWEAARELPSVAPEAAARMRACIEQSVSTTPLDVVDNLLSLPERFATPRQ